MRHDGQSCISPMTSAQTDWFDTPAPPPADEVLHVDVDGYEGPLDLLLDLARRQKVDLSGISILALAEQYLAFIEKVRERRIEVAADYLVMAAWLAYLKSRLMVPQAASDDEPSGEMLAAMLQFRLKRLEAMREAANRLMNRPRLGFQVYARGMPEPIEIARSAIWEASLYDLLKAYSSQRERGVVAEYAPKLRTVWSLQDARDILLRLIGDSVEWVPLDRILAEYLAKPSERATVRASTFASSLELVRQGEVEIRQGETFGPLLMRRRRKDTP
ncbi:MAG: segregation/condensation protein A [Phyllobacteriaceae bacterium]|nr:segregation/condensation protein A [Phyllobacteriaceae bacterium]